MVTDPCNIIKGLQLIVKANIANINAVIRKFDKKGELHMYTGIVDTLPLDKYPSLEFEATSGDMDWLTTSAQWSEYSIDCVLTVNCGACIDQGMQYITALSKAITTVFNWPVNMTWPIPDEVQYDPVSGESKPLICEYSGISHIDYMATKEYAIRVARWSIPCRVVEPFPEDSYQIGPKRVKWRKL